MNAKSARVPDLMRVRARTAIAHALPSRWAGAILASIVFGCLGACSGNAHIDVANSQTADPATVDYPIFYVKRTIPKMPDDLRVLNDIVPSADLYKRDSASPSANETNITARVTANAVYDVKDVDVSANGTMVVFAMRGPLTPKQKTTAAPSWRIWLYTIATDTLGPVIEDR